MNTGPSFSLEGLIGFSLSRVQCFAAPLRTSRQAALNPAAAASVLWRMQNSFRPSPLRRICALLAVAGLAIALSACSSSGSSKGASGTKAPAAGGGSGVSISGFKFTVASVTAGSTVTVKNNDGVTHTVTSDDGTSFNVTVPSGKTATFTAPAAGTYKFHCNIHSSMHGTLTVT
jgi:plastocyanin